MTGFMNWFSEGFQTAITTMTRNLNGSPFTESGL